MQSFSKGDLALYNFKGTWGSVLAETCSAGYAAREPACTVLDRVKKKAPAQSLDTQRKDKDDLKKGDWAQLEEWIFVIRAGSKRQVCDTKAWDRTGTETFCIIPTACFHPEPKLELYFCLISVLLHAEGMQISLAKHMSKWCYCSWNSGRLSHIYCIFSSYKWVFSLCSRAAENK